MKIFDKKIIGLIIGLVFIVLILKNIDVNKSIEAVKHLNLFYACLMIPVYFSSFLFRSLRWRAILEQSGNEIRLSSFLDAIFRGWSVNCVVPARGGELYRAYYFGKKEGLSKTTILSSIVLERIFDGLVLFLILFFLVSFIYSSKKFFGVAVTAGTIFVGFFLVLLSVSKFYKNAFLQEKFKKLSGFEFINTNKIFNKISEMFSSFMNGLEIFHSPFLIFKSFLFTVLVWICEGITIFLLIKGFGYSIGIFGSLFVLSIIAFVSLIPGGPASLGPLQWGYILALGFFKIPQETAFAASLFNQVFAIFVIFSGSLFFITAEHLNFKNKKTEEITIQVV